MAVTTVNDGLGLFLSRAHTVLGNIYHGKPVYKKSLEKEGTLTYPKRTHKKIRDQMGLLLTLYIVTTYFVIFEAERVGTALPQRKR